jgi:polar amino acid transport system substrate-binding protein
MTKLKFVNPLVVGLSLTLLCIAQAGAQSLLERAKAGETIRIGYSNEAPYAYQNEQGEMDGFVNVVGLEILKRLGIENIEGVLTEWGSLIPGLQANRFDIITAGMFVLPNRCEQVAFTEPMGVFAEAFMVPAGNPMELHSFEDVRDNPEAILVTGAGYSTVQHARTVGIPDERIMQVPDPAAILAAVRAGRAHAASATVFAMRELVERGGDDVEMARPFTAPDFTKGYSAYAFRKADQDFVDAFNAELAAFLGTEEMLSMVERFGYGDTEVPDGSVTTAELCEG